MAKNIMSFGETIRAISNELTGDAKVDFDSAIKSRMLEADEKCAKCLADANEAEERGQKKKAERLYQKSGFWRDRYNKLVGNT